MLLVGQRMYDSYAEALEDSVICQLSVSDVEQHLLANPRIAIRISRRSGRSAGGATHRPCSASAGGPRGENPAHAR
ncbi:hypothetical protein [Nesterenkonia sphaerica]|uniref:hypothetical protein n=1 Tax=Nesterenkonia sphaerica TaxID=1804988 RepID=UPI003C7AD468